MDLTALKTEIDIDPKALGYSEKTNQAIADLLNTVGLSNETIDVGVIEAYKIVNALENSEVSSLASLQLSLLNLIISAGQVDASNTKIQAFFMGLFDNGTTTRANLITLSKKSVSRAEKLGLGIVKYYDVGQAQNL